MKRVFNIIIGLDVLLLLLPTRRLGSRGEFWIAAILAVATAVLWVCLKAARDDSV